MKKALLILLVVWSAIALCAQNNDLTSRDIEHSNNPAFSQNRPQSPTFRDFGFNIAPDYNLPDADDLLDPLTGAFNEDAAWTKDFTRHIVNPESIQLYLTFSNYTHFTITQPDPGNPFKWQFQPIPGNWNGSELVTLTLSDSLPGRPGRTLMTTTVRINVTPVPDPPIWSGLPPDNTFFTDEEVPLLINFQDYVDCVDADSTNFDLFVQPAEFPIDISQAPTEHGYMVIFSPQDDYYGLATYTVTAVDRISNALSSQIINISVQPVNDAPEFQFHLPYSLNQTISQNDSLDFFVIVNDPDNPPETLNVQWILTSVQGRDSQTTMVPGIFGWGHRFTEPGYFTVECLVADSLTSSSLVWNIAVKPTGPSFEPSGGTYDHTVDVAISTEDEFSGALIYYTLDGSTPSESSQLYTVPVQIPTLGDVENNVTLKAMFVHPAYPPSGITSQAYRITGTVADPVFAPGGGVYYSPQQVHLSCSNAGASIYYTLNGADPVPGNPDTYLFNNWIAVNSDLTIKAVAIRDGWQPSNVITQFYHITGVVVINNLVLTPPPLQGDYYTIFSGQSVDVTVTEMALSPTGATLYYTLDYSYPSPDNPSSYVCLPGQLIQLTQSTMITFRAFLTDWLPSSTMTFYYEIHTMTELEPFTNGTVFDPAPGYFTEPVYVSISSTTNPPGAPVYYTIDGSDPVEDPGLLYTGPVLISQTTTLKAIAVFEGIDPSVVHSGDFIITGTVDAPVFDPPAGSYDPPVSIAISSMAGASIYYTLDGSEPTSGSTPYSAPVQLLAGVHQLRARAYLENWAPSPVSEAVYSVGILPVPVFDLPGGIYQDPIVVHLSVPGVADASIHYTTDGTDPTSGSALYNSSTGIPVGLQTTVTIKAIAVKTGWVDSQIAQNSYQVTGTVATPAFAPDGGVYTSATAVTISTATPDTYIKYTLDGQDPTQDYGNLYSGPVTISSSATLKARAFRADWRQSAVYGAVYTIYGNIADPVFTPPAGTYTEPVEVYISVNPPEASIYYTTDGSVPSQSHGTLYTGTPILVSADLLLRAAAFETGWNPSAVVDAQYYITGTVAMPTFAPPAGQYASAQQITISTVPVTAAIKYTLDGTEPGAANGIIYSGPITVSVNTVIKAYAYQAGWDPSPVVSAAYVINGPVGTPLIRPAAGYYNAVQTITITAYPAQATIRYTLDGTVPTLVNGATYTGPFQISGHTIIKAYAYLENWLDSAVETSEYFFIVANPVITPPAGTYPDPQTITMSVTTPGASIRYTLDGSDPSSTAGILYLTPFAINASTTVKALAYRENWLSSNVITNSYLINGPVATPVFSVPQGNYYTAFSVGISTLPTNATIYYTTDGTDPTQTNGIAYTAPVPVTQNTILKARAYLVNWMPSAIATADYNLYASPVSFAPGGGTYNAIQYVALSTMTPGATISYTIDGSDPAPGSSPVYDSQNPVVIDHSLTLKSIASLTNWYSSAISSASYVIDIPLPTVATPQILPPSGAYTVEQTVTMSTTTPEATIVYTMDGTDPSLTNGTVYTGSFVVSDDVLIKARGFKDGYNPSALASVQYIIAIPVQTVAAPAFAPQAGVYNEPIQVTITSQTPDATIRYTLDGSEPSETLGTVYNGPINISVTTTVKAIAYKTGMNTSLISNASYVINIIIPEVAAPMFSLPSGTYTQAIDVSLSTTTQNASIRYTTDGTTPSPTVGILYSAPIHIPGDSSMIIQAIAYRDGWNPSPVVAASYIITGTVTDVQFNPPAGTYTQATSVILTTATLGASIRYTTDGSVPNEASNLYTTAIVVPLNSTMTISARAYKPGWLPSSVVQNNYVVTGQVGITQPAFTPAAGIYTSAQNVVINVPVPMDAVVHYTVDGSDPTEISPIYTAAVNIPLNTNMTVKVRAYKADWLPSPIYSASYTITGQVTLPAALFNPAAGVYQTAQSISLNPPVTPPDATLRYTLDGSVPTEASPAYTNPIPLALNSTTTISVKAFKTNWIPSVTATATYVITGQVAISSPVFSPPAGVYSTAQQITVNAPVPADATVRYTTDGSDPTETSPAYTAPISLPLNTSLTLKVRAFKTDWTPSPVYTGMYTTTGAVSIALPVFDPAPGTYTSPQTVAVNTQTIPANAVIHYTTDGSDPTESSPVYSVPVSVNNNQSVTVKVRAYATDWQPSAIYSGTYTVTGQVTITEPVFTPAAGIYQTAQVVTLNTLTSPVGATLRYTLDGTEPTESSTLYSAAINLGLNTVTTIKVKAFYTNWQPSQTYSATYTVTGTVSITAPVFTPPEGIYQTPQIVSISTNTIPTGATIHYTTDGSAPTEASPVYSEPIQIPLNAVMNINAVAIFPDWTPSPVYSATYAITGQIQIAVDMFTPPAGTYQTVQNIILNEITTPAGATLRYTLDGSEPTESSPAYIAPIPLPLNSTTTISVKAFLANWIPSVTVTATYVITGQIVFNTPVFSPEPGIYQTPQSVYVAGTIPADATVRYTLDGSEPTSSSSPYMDSITMSWNTNTTLKVKAFKTGWISSVTHTGVYTVTGQTNIAEPVFDPPPGTYTTAQNVSINSLTFPSGALVRYTLDGTEPDSGSPLYTTPIQLSLDDNYEIRARSFAQNWIPSEVYIGYYIMTGTVVIPDPVFNPAGGTYTTDLILVLNTQTIPAGATLHYTMDGTDPDESSPVYSQPLVLHGPDEIMVKVRAYKNGWNPSAVSTAVYRITGQVQLLTPYFDPLPGVYSSPVSVGLAGGVSPTEATIRYTTDGTDPTEESPVFTDPIEIGLNTIGFTLKIRAFLEDWLPSPIQTGVYSVTGQVELAQNMFSPEPGTFQTAQYVTLLPPVLPSGAELRYTTNGNEPTLESQAYTEPISVPLNTVLTLKVKGFATNWQPSETAAAVYEVTGTVSSPVLYPPGGNYSSPVSVEITSPTPGAEIRYTTDGSQPTEASALYSQPILIQNFVMNITVTAKAFKANWTPSPASSATYSVLSTPINVRGLAYSGYIRVLWNLPSQLKELQGFNVYRRVLGATQYIRINTTLVNSQIDGNYYFDDYAISLNESYEYYVTAVYDGVESHPSASTVEYYESPHLEISAASGAHPNPADQSTVLNLKLNRGENVQITITIYDFAGKKIRTLDVPVANKDDVAIAWDLKNSSGKRVGRGTYFARVVAKDQTDRTERVIKIAVK